ncbi:MAG TPA: transcription-repair coupling factor, partial [Halomonas sp.]|nr:transcription-repair coupling factor [Halomonas sp.]
MYDLGSVSVQNDTFTMPSFSLLEPPQPQGIRDTLYLQAPPGSATALALAQVASSAPLLVITPNTASAQRLEQDLAFYSSVPVLPFPDWETLPYDSFSPHQDIISARLRTLRLLQDGVRGIVLVPVNTLMQRLPPVSYIAGRVMTLKAGATLNRETFRESLSRAGYRAVETVYEPGEYAMRGAIIDLFAMGMDEPIRIDLFDDEIDTLRHFDPGSQRSTNKVDVIELLPAHEYSLSRSAIACFREQFETLFDVDPRQCPLYNDALKAIPSPGLEQYLPLFFEETASLFEHLTVDTRIALLPDVFHAAEQHWQSIESRYENLGVDPTRPLLPPHRAFFPVNEVFSAIKARPRLEFTEDDSQRHALAPLAQALPSLAINARAKQPLSELASFLDNHPKTRMLFVAESRGRREALEEVLSPLKLSLPHSDSFQAFLAGSEHIAITESLVGSGLWLTEPDVAVISETELFGDVVRQSRRREKATDDNELAVRHLSELREGAPVVHQAHGVGRYLGLETLEAGGQANEFLALSYADGAKLYVPVDSLHLISRYSGADDELAPLHKLGSDQWEKARRKAAEKIRDTAAELLDIYARREAQQGTVYDPPGDEYVRFAASFPFEETPDQKAAIEAVISDMVSPQPMDRVVCGDVGFGKTEVA